MTDLNNIDEINKLDPQGAYGSTFMLPQQSEGAWNEVKDLPVSGDFSNIKNIVCCGMGA